jgi:hypothetical protein
MLAGLRQGRGPRRVELTVARANPWQPPVRTAGSRTTCSHPSSDPERPLRAITLGLQELWTVAATNKYLARINKSSASAHATNKREALPAARRNSFGRAANLARPVAGRRCRSFTALWRREVATTPTCIFSSAAYELAETAGVGEATPDSLAQTGGTSKSSSFMTAATRIAVEACVP